VLNHIIRNCRLCQ